MNILELVKNSETFKRIPVRTQIEMGFDAASCVPKRFLDLLADAVSRENNGEVRILTIQGPIRFDKHDCQYAYASGTDIMCHEKGLSKWNETTLSDIVDRQIPCVCSIRTNYTNGKLSCVFCSIYDMPNIVATQLSEIIERVLADYLVEFPSFEEDLEDENDGLRLQKEIITDFRFNNGAFTKWYKFHFGKPTSKTEFVSILDNNGLWFLPKDGETLEINSTDGGSVWDYYAEHGEIPDEN